MTNYKTALMIGDHFYVIRKVSQNLWVITGSGDIRPQMERGVWQITNMPFGTSALTAPVTLTIEQDESQQDYHDHVLSPILALIKKGNVFVAKTNKQRTRYVKKNYR